MLYRAVRRFNLLKAAIGREPFHRRDLRCVTELHGSSYGGWAVLPASLTSNSIVYSFGLGRDISFDLSVIAKYGCRVFGFDPTPKSLEWLRRTEHSPLFSAEGIALSNRNGSLRLFHPPEGTADDVSASALSSGESLRPYFDAECSTLGTLMKKYSQGRCDYLKLDIEGSEYEVLDEASESGVLRNVRQLAVEFHHWMLEGGCASTNRSVERLRADGFRIAWISRTNHEYLFVRA